MRKNFLLQLLLLLVPVTQTPANEFDPDKAFSSTYRILCVRERLPTSTSYGMGSGFLVNSSGYVATNYHVVEGAIEVYVLQRQGEVIKVWEANVHSNHEDQDISILRVPGITGTPVTFPDDKPKMASAVFAVGFPGQADEEAENQRFYAALRKSNYKDLPADPSYRNYVSPTIRTGNIESIRRRPWGPRKKLAMVINHNANFTQGNSGGPLILKNGDVVGVNTIMRGEARANGVLIGNIMRISSSYTELTAILNRMDIKFNVRQPVSENEEPEKEEDPDPDPVKEDPKPAPVEEQKEPAPEKEKKSRSRSKDFDPVVFLEENAGYFAIGLGSLVAVIALIFGLKKPRPETAPLAVTPPPGPHLSPSPQAVSPPPFQPSHEVSVPITPAPAPAARDYERTVPANLHPGCQLRSTPDSPVQVSFNIRSNEIPSRGFVIGRDSSVPGRIAHTSVSRTHSKIKVSDGELYISDAGSSNGTIIGDKKLEPKTGMVLRTGDTITLGDVSLKVTIL